jgi:hypothetical protein
LLSICYKWLITDFPFQSSACVRWRPSSRANAPPSSKFPRQTKRSALPARARVKTLDWNRHDKNIHGKIQHWFDIVGKELDRPDVLPENGYNMDGTGVMLSILSSPKVLVGMECHLSRTVRAIGSTEGFRPVPSVK